MHSLSAILNKYFENVFRKSGRVDCLSYISFMKEQIECFMEKDPSIHSKWEVYWMPGFKAIYTWYFTHKLYQKKHFALARYLSLKIKEKPGLTFILAQPLDIAFLLIMV